MRWDEAVPELPSGWAWATLGAVASTQLGKMLSAKSKVGVSPRPYLRNKNVQWGRFDLSDLAAMDFTAAEMVKYALKTGDLIVCEGGEVGRAAVWSGASGEVYFQKALHRVRPDDGVDSRYLMYALELMARSRYLDSFTSGSTIKHLPQEDLRVLPTPIAPSAEQQRIIDELERRLSHVDAAVGGLRACLARLASTRRTVLNGLVDGSLVGADATTWAEVATGEVCDVKGGIQKQPRRAPRDNPHPFLRVANVGRGTLDLGEVHEIELFGDELDTYRLQRGDLLVVEGNGSVGHIGRAAMWDGSIDDCVHQNHLIRVRPRSAVSPEYLALAWNAPTTIAQLIQVASSTSGLHTLSTGKVKDVRLSVPDLDTQAALVQEAERRLSLIDAAERTIKASLARAEQLRRSLLAAAFSGRLVPQDPDDEPASELLERIKAQRSSETTAKSPRRKKTKEPVT